RCLEDLRNPERAADLHELPARDHHLAPARRGRQREHDRGRVVVHRDRGGGAGQLAHERPPGGLAGAGRLRRAPASRSYSRFEYPLAALSIASSASNASGARPRFVWITTPVALI